MHCQAYQLNGRTQECLGPDHEYHLYFSSQWDCIWLLGKQDIFLFKAITLRGTQRQAEKT